MIKHKEKENLELEIHPFPPYIPQNAKVLIMGTFPPQPKRWAMEFYYPNRTNDFWPVMGLIFFGDKKALYDAGNKRFDLVKIKNLLNEKGIALSDTGYKIKRLKGNASDKFLEIIEPVDIYSLLNKIPECKAIATTGEKAAATLASLTNTFPPKIGNYEHMENGIEIWRMPSTSRAYPLSPEKKAESYAALFRHIGLID